MRRSDSSPFRHDRHFAAEAVEFQGENVPVVFQEEAGGPALFVDFRTASPLVSDTVSGSHKFRVLFPGYLVCRFDICSSKFSHQSLCSQVRDIVLIGDGSTCERLRGHDFRIGFSKMQGQSLAWHGLTEKA